MKAEKEFNAEDRLLQTIEVYSPILVFDFLPSIYFLSFGPVLLGITLGNQIPLEYLMWYALVSPAIDVWKTGNPRSCIGACYIYLWIAPVVIQSLHEMFSPIIQQRLRSAAQTRSRQLAYTLCKLSRSWLIIFTLHLSLFCPSQCVHQLLSTATHQVIRYIDASTPFGVRALRKPNRGKPAGSRQGGIGCAIGFPNRGSW